MFKTKTKYEGDEMNQKIKNRKNTKENGELNEKA